MAVLNIGSLNLDYVYRVDHFVRPGETLAASHRAVHAGGKGLNQSVALARAGATVLHAGCVGADGGMLLEVLKGEGVEAAGLMALLERRYPDVNLILTLGNRGACGRVPGAEPFFVPAVKMKAVDTTGAGDTFAGYAVAALAAGEDLRTAMNRAAKASAISVTREGAATSIPRRSEVEALAV